MQRPDGFEDPTIPGVVGFFYFVALRQNAYWRKQRGEGPPFSEDWALARGHYPNIFRELDKGTIYYRRQMELRRLPEVIFGTVAYRLLNNQGTFERNGGIPFIGASNEWLLRIQEDYLRGAKVFTSRHLNPGMRRYREAVNHVAEWADSYASRIANSDSSQQMFNIFKEIPGTGSFFAWQMTCDMMEGMHDHPTINENQWAYMGPGPQKAIQMIREQLTGQVACLNFAKVLRSEQMRYLRDPRLEFTFPEGIPELTLKNIEHGLCEYFRWVWAYWKR